MPVQPLKIKLNFSSMNVSVQVGDIAYYSYQPLKLGGFDHSSLRKTMKLGKIIGVNVVGQEVVNPGYIAPITSPHDVNIIVEHEKSDYSLGPGLDEPAEGILNNSFISFAKEKKINTSSLLGYYADVKFVNDSKKKAELFSVGSELTESSK